MNPLVLLATLLVLTGCTAGKASDVVCTTRVLALQEASYFGASMR